MSVLWELGQVQIETCILSEWKEMQKKKENARKKEECGETGILILKG